MSATSASAKSSSTVNKPLWAAVSVLGVAVLALGATLIYVQTRPEEPRLAVLSAAAPAPTVAASTSTAALPAPLDSGKAATPKKVTHNTSKPVATNATGHQAITPAPRAICANCGTVESVTPIQRDGTAGGVGAVAGGVLGAVVGNQVGGGNGKTLATILGAVGGGVAGNTVEKKMKKETVYQVQVRMEDGSSRTLEQAVPAMVGAKVIVDGNTLQPIR
jgi:outer membrane lipoprotein SlyB